MIALFQSACHAVAVFLSRRIAPGTDGWQARAERAARWARAPMAGRGHLGAVLAGFAVEPRPVTTFESILGDGANAGAIGRFAEPGGFREIRLPPELVAVPEGLDEFLADARHVEVTADGFGGCQQTALLYVEAFEAVVARGGRVVATVREAAGSAHALLFVLAPHRRMARGATLLHHAGVLAVVGDSAALRDAAGKLEEQEAEVIRRVAKRTGQAAGVVSEWFRPGIDMTVDAEAALRLGMVDEVFAPPAGASQ